MPSEAPIILQNPKEAKNVQTALDILAKYFPGVIIAVINSVNEVSVRFHSPGHDILQFNDVAHRLLIEEMMKRKMEVAMQMQLAQMTPPAGAPPPDNDEPLPFTPEKT